MYTSNYCEVEYKENSLKEELETQEANSDDIIAFRYIYDLSEVDSKETPVLETDRLVLRKIQPEDTEAIFNCWMQDEEVSRYMWWKASDDINEAKEFVEFELRNLTNPQWNRWIILEKDSSQIIGTCLIYFNEDENNWDISYNLGKQFWGKGYITEAMKRVMEYAKDELRIKECTAIHAVENPASGRVIEKLGFTYEKEVPYECSGGELVTTGKYYRWMCE